MKSAVLALVAFLLVAGLLVTPTPAAAEACGSTYTVKGGDTLSKICRHLQRIGFQPYRGQPGN